MRLIAQGGNHGGLHGCGHDHAGVLAAVDNVRHELGGAGHEGGAVAGQVRLLGQRVDGQQAGEVAVAHSRIQDGGHRLTAAGLVPGAPTELRVALVRGHHGTDFAGLRHDVAQLLHSADRAIRVGRGVHPNQLHAAAGVGVQLVQAVGGHGFGAGEAGTHVIGGVGDARVHDHVAGAQAQQEGQPGYELLRADRGHDGLRVQALHAAAALKPFGDGLAQGGGAVGGRVAGGVGCLGERVADELGGGVHGGADGQVHRAVGVSRGGGAVGGERLPGVFGQVQAVSHCVTWSLGDFRHFSLSPGLWG